jgi:hypothetical protein
MLLRASNAINLSHYQSYELFIRPVMDKLALKLELALNYPKANYSGVKLVFFLSIIFRVSVVALRETEIKLRARAKSEFT